MRLGASELGAQRPVMLSVALLMSAVAQKLTPDSTAALFWRQGA
jgi:hypothetical protein